MRKNFFFGLMALMMGMFVFASCSSDDDDDLNVSKAQLVGKWINTRVDWDESGEKDHETYNDASRYLELESDGTGTVNPYYLFENQIRGTFQWSVSGNKLTIVESDGDTTVYIVKKVNGTELVLSWEDYDDEGDYFIETHTFKKAVETEDE